MPVCDACFSASTVQGRDWHGIQLVKRLRGLGEAWKQRAEALAFLERFDEAEVSGALWLYMHCGRGVGAVTGRHWRHM